MDHQPEIATSLCDKDLRPTYTSILKWKVGAGLAGHPGLRNQHAEDHAGKAGLVWGMGI